MRKKIIIAMAITALLAIVVASPTAFASDPVERQLCAVIRNAGSGWAQIGGAHKSEGLRAVTNDTKTIAVFYTFTADYVKTVAVTVDETMAAGGYTVGASVGRDRMYIYIYKDGVLVDPNTYVSGGGNIWIYGLFEAAP